MPHRSHSSNAPFGGVRVVLWLDLRRKMPFYVGILNRLCLWLVYRDKSVEKIRRGAVIGAEGIVNHPA